MQGAWKYSNLMKSADLLHMQYVGRPFAKAHVHLTSWQDLGLDHMAISFHVLYACTMYVHKYNIDCDVHKAIVDMDG